jgi:hypothetical protein
VWAAGGAEDVRNLGSVASLGASTVSVDMPVKAGIQYPVTPEFNTRAAAYWIIRLRG